jgi:hypothetical protein
LETCSAKHGIAKLAQCKAGPQELQFTIFRKDHRLDASCEMAPLICMADHLARLIGESRTGLIAGIVATGP